MKNLNQMVYLSTRKGTLRNHVDKFFPCTECNLHKEAHRYVIFRGKHPCDVLFIGEAPGKDENDIGLPFIGRAGRLLDKMLNSLQETYPELPDFSWGISNIICCIPTVMDVETGNVSLRPPQSDEIEACSPRLQHLIQECKPKLIVLLGKTAEKSLVPKTGSTPQDTDYTCISLQHPAYILRQGGLGSVEFKRNLLYLKEGIEAYVSETPKKQPKEKVTKTADKGSSKGSIKKRKKKKKS